MAGLESWQASRVSYRDITPRAVHLQWKLLRMSHLKHRIPERRHLRVERLEDRRVLAAAFLSSSASDGLAEIAAPSAYALSDWDSIDMQFVVEAQAESQLPLYFSSIRKIESGSFEFIESNEPANDFDFSIQRARPFHLAAEILDTTRLQIDDTIVLDLFEDARYSAVLQSKSTNVNGTTSLVVQLDQHDFAFGYISITGSDYLVSIDVPGERAYYETRPHLQSGAMFLVQFDPNRSDVLESSPSVIDNSIRQVGTRDETPDGSLKTADGRPTLQSGPSGGSSNGQTSIDVMVVYTPAAQSWSSNINNTVATAMSRSNIASSNSNLGMSFNLVYSGLVNYTESGSSTDLGRLRGQSDGFMDEIHAIRNAHAADMVAILTFTNDTGGIAYLLNTRYGSEDLAFSLTRVQQASSTDTFIHELGHNMGAMHSKFQNVQAGPTFWQDWPENNWSAGWRFQGDNGTYYTSVMAYQAGQYYPDGINATRLPFFSDPGILFQGQPVGHPEDGDNARTLRDVRNYIGQYRDSDTLLYCTARGGFGDLGITNVQFGSIDQNAGANAYHDFSFQSTDIEVGSSQQLTISVTSASSLNQLRVWVDWNDDKDFFDAGELVFISGSGFVSQYSVPIAPPPGTTPGQKRLRIRLHQPNLGGNLSPCGSSTTGEVQDFRLNVTTEPATVVGSFVIHTGWTGSMGDAVDSFRTLAKESLLPQTLGFDNLINSSQGITGIRWDFLGLPGNLSESDFIFQWSPQGAFSEDSHPPADWQVAPNPSSVLTVVGSPSQVVALWPEGSIMNRWLRITLLANANTGLLAPEVYYIGHLLGETTGAVDSLFTVSFVDISEIRSAVGQSVTSGSMPDIDKDGSVTFADITAMRLNVGAQLPAITIPAMESGGSGEAAPVYTAGTGRSEEKPILGRSREVLAASPGWTVCVIGRQPSTLRKSDPSLEPNLSPHATSQPLSRESLQDLVLEQLSEVERLEN